MKINDIIMEAGEDDLPSGAKTMNGLTVIPLAAFLKGDSETDESVNEAPGDEFGLGARIRNASDDEMKAYMQRVKDKKEIRQAGEKNTDKETKKDKYKMPFLHPSNIKIKDENGKDFDLDALRADIMQRPNKITTQNQKMQHSDGTSSVFLNVGLPALKGLAVNEKTGDFVIVDTCPGAGACQTFCYAMKGSYVMFKAVSMNQTRLLNYLLNDPDGFAAEMDAEIRLAQAKNRGTQLKVRWHDAGDFFSQEYLDVAYKIARANPKVLFYAYTKMSGIAAGEKPENFLMNFSGGAKPQQQKGVDFEKTKHSRVVPNSMFWDLIVKKGSKPVKDAKGRMHFASQENLNTFKQRIGNTFHVDPKSVLTYDEMMSTKDSGEPKWNVIVMPGDGDDSAARKDVIGTYLLFH